MSSGTSTLTTAAENTLKQRRWGCTCGCLAFLIAIILGSLAFFYYALRPWPPSGPERWLRSDTKAFGVVRFSSADAGMIDLMQLWLKRMEEHFSRNKSEQDQKAIHASFVLARQMTDWVFHPPIYFYEFGEEPAANQVVVLQFRHFFGWLLIRNALARYDFVPTQQSENVTIFKLAALEGTTGPLVGLSPRLLAISENPGAILPTANAPTRRAESDSPNEKFISYFEDLHVTNPESGEDAAFLFLNERGRLGHLLERIGNWTGLSGLKEQVEQLLATQKLALDDVTALRLSADVMSADRLKLTWCAYVSSPDQAKRLAQALRTLTEQLGASTSPVRTVQAEVRTAGTSCLFVTTVSGLRSTLNELFGKTLPPEQISKSPSSADAGSH